jgi:hypothetical protein
MMKKTIQKVALSKSQPFLMKYRNLKYKKLESLEYHKKKILLLQV